jgi:hypothetical protein
MTFGYLAGIALAEPAGSEAVADLSTFKRARTMQ